MISAKVLLPLICLSQCVARTSWAPSISYDAETSTLYIESTMRSVIFSMPGFAGIGLVQTAPLSPTDIVLTVATSTEIVTKQITHWNPIFFSDTSAEEEQSSERTSIPPPPRPPPSSTRSPKATPTQSLILITTSQASVERLTSFYRIDCKLNE